MFKIQHSDELYVKNSPKMLIKRITGYELYIGLRHIYPGGQWKAKAGIILHFNINEIIFCWK
jgi:hypothetical protein